MYSPLGQELMPLAVGVQVLIGNEETAITRRDRLPYETHPRLSGSTPSFTAIACSTAADDVVPSMFTPTMARNNVIQSQHLGLLSAILASIIITAEYFDPSHFPYRTRTLHQSPEMNH